MAIFAPAGELFIFDTKWKLNHIPENMVKGGGRTFYMLPISNNS